MLKHLLVTLAATTVLIATPHELIFQTNLNDIVSRVNLQSNWNEQKEEPHYLTIQPEVTDKVIDSDFNETKNEPEQPVISHVDSPVTAIEKPNVDKENTTSVATVKPSTKTNPVSDQQPIKQESPVTTVTTPKSEPTPPIETKTSEANTTPEPTPTPQETPTVSSVPEATFELEVLRLTNIERINVGLKPLSYNSSLEEGAKIRSIEIIELFSHTRPDGSRFFTVFGPDFRFRNIGENLASGFRTPAQVVAAWMNSTSHRANILNANFEELAVASTRGEDGRVRWVQIFYRAQ